MCARIVLGAAFVLGLLACQRSETPSATTTTTSSESVVNGDVAMRRLTRARCEREEYCDNIGDRRAFASFAECTQELGRIASSAPLSAACPRGIDEALLEDCLSEVRKEVCGNPRHTAHRIEQCKDDKLCVP